MISGDDRKVLNDMNNLVIDNVICSCRTLTTYAYLLDPITKYIYVRYQECDNDIELELIGCWCY